MSGFEVLGVVLGTIPLVISALEHYQNGLHTIRRWRSSEAELQSLKRRLGSENAIFINTCQQLLSGIVGSLEHEKLIGEPFGELWGNPEIRNQLALRLDHVFEPFEATVAAMEGDLRGIKAKLGLDEQYKVKWTEGKAIAKEIKRATFTLNRSHFEDLLESISKSNQHLKTLTNQSIQLEPERRVKNHGRLFSQLNEVSRSMYRAIRNSFLCGCPESHRVSLRLRKPKLMPRDEKTQILHNSTFQCALSYHSDNNHEIVKSNAWSLMILRIYESPSEEPDIAGNMPAIPNDSGLPITSLKTSTEQIKGRKKLQSVKFLDEVRTDSEKTQLHYAVKTVLSTSHEMAISTAFTALHIQASTTAIEEKRLTEPVDLCHLVQTGNKGNYGDCFGLISDSASSRYPKFGVHPFPEHNNDTPMISLREVFDDGETNFPRLSYAEGIKLAVDICSGVLQLLKTSWLPQNITSRDIFFPMEEGQPTYGHAYVARNFSDPDQESSIEPKGLQMQNMRTTMSSLGLLLLEVLFFETLDHVWDTKAGTTTPKSKTQSLDWNVATDLLRRVEIAGSPNFYSAVNRFLFCKFTCLDPTMSDSFYKEFYGKTIALLEEDYKASISLW